jgi:hypothetical protein
MRGRPPNAAASFSLSKVSSRFHAGLLKVPAGADRTPHSSGTLADGSQLIESCHRCTRDDPEFRHRGVLLFAACAHHSSSGCGVISTGMGAGAGAGSTAGGSSGSTSMGEAGSGVILRCRGIPRGRSGAMMSMGALGGSYPCAWAVATKATSNTRRRVIPPRKIRSGSARVILRAGAGAGKGRRASRGFFDLVAPAEIGWRRQDNRQRGLSRHARDPEPRCDTCLAGYGRHWRFDSASS